MSKISFQGPVDRLLPCCLFITAEVNTRRREDARRTEYHRHTPK